LEARWAVFFDALGITYEYETEGFELQAGIRYLPDFYLPTFSRGMWCEVKPNGGDFSKTALFASESHWKVWLCEGPPDFVIYKYLEWGSFGATHPQSEIRCGVPNAWEAQGEDRMFGAPCHWDDVCIDACGSIRKCYAGHHKDDFDYHYIQAVYASRQARFEHGETPAIALARLLDRAVSEA